MIEYLKTSLEAQAGDSIRVIEGTKEPAAATAHAPKPTNRLMLEADTVTVERAGERRDLRSDHIAFHRFVEGIKEDHPGIARR